MLTEALPEASRAGVTQAFVACRRLRHAKQSQATTSSGETPLFGQTKRHSLDA